MNYNGVCRQECKRLIRSSPGKDVLHLPVLLNICLWVWKKKTAENHLHPAIAPKWKLETGPLASSNGGHSWTCTRGGLGKQQCRSCLGGDHDGPVAWDDCCSSLHATAIWQWGPFHQWNQEVFPILRILRYIQVWRALQRPGDSFQKDFNAVIEFLKKEQILPGRIYKVLVKYWPGTESLFQWIGE